MGFLIATNDGQTRICTRTATAAAVHVRRLRAAGTSFQVTDAHGGPCDMRLVESAVRYAITVAPVMI